MVQPRIYRVFAWGNVSHDVPGDVELKGVTRLEPPSSPYAVANEFICGRLAFLLGLPVLPGVLAHDPRHRPAYVSFRLAPDAGARRLVVPTELVSATPELAAGIVVFDCWIGNADRGEETIAFSVGHEAAPFLVGHGQAPFGARAGSAARRLAEMRDLPCVGGCLSGLLEDGAHLYPWIQRISSLPSWCVADLCQEAQDAELITPLEADAALDFLLHRKAKLGELIGSAPDKLPHVARV